MVRRSVAGSVAAVVVCVAVSVAGLPLSRVMAAEGDDSSGSQSLPPIDAGESSYPAPQVPPGMESVSHEVPALDAVSVGMVVESSAPHAVEGLPVELRAIAEQMISGKPEVLPAESPSGEIPVAEDVRVQSLDAVTVDALGGEVLGFGLDPHLLDPSLRVEVSIDLSEYRYAFGGDWAQRVGLQVSRCSVLSAEAAGESAGEVCGEALPVDSAIDPVSGAMEATVALSTSASPGFGSSRRLLTGSGSTLSLYSTVGSFAATSLSSNGTWRVAGNLGDFSYSYPIATPPSFNGLSPSVSFDYSSGVANGMTADVNSQASPLGVGWSLSAG